MRGEIMRGHTFPKGITPKMNVIVWLEVKLVSIKAAFQPLRYEDSTSEK